MKTLIVLCILFMFGCATTGKPDPNVVRVVYEKSRGEHVMDFVKIGFPGRATNWCERPPVETDRG